jgi:hypothetical protein
MSRLPFLVFASLVFASLVFVSNAFAQVIDWRPYDAVEHNYGKVTGGIAGPIYAIGCDSGGLAYLVSQSVNVSSDNGRTWKTTAIGTAADVAGGPLVGEAVITGESPVYTTDAGTHWIPLESPAADAFCSFATDGWIYTSSATTVCAASNPKGPWIRCSQAFGQIMDLWISPTGELSVFAYSHSDTAIYRSTDHGQTWRLSCHVPYPYAGFGVSEDGKGRIAVHADGDPDYISSDFGSTWGRADSMIFYLPGATVVVPRHQGQPSIEYLDTVRPFFFGFPFCRTPDGTIIGGSVASAQPYETFYHYELREYTPGAIFGRNDSDVFIDIAPAGNGQDPYAYATVSAYDRCAMDSDGFLYQRSTAVGRRVAVYTPEDESKWLVLEAPPIFQLRGAPDGSVYASGSNGVLYHSTDRGWSWSQIQAASGRLLNFDITKDGTFYLINDSSTIYRSSDGIAWSVSGVAPDHTSRFYACRQRLFAVRDSDRTLTVVESTDDGNTWSSVQTPEPLMSFDVIADRTLFALTPDHAYLESGSNWRAIDGGLPRRLDNEAGKPLLSSIGHDMGGHLYIGVFDAGLYRTELTYEQLVVTSTHDTNATRLPMYPNPAIFEVTADLPGGSSGIVMRDALGREVIRIATQDRTCRVDLHSVPPGVYSVETSGGQSHLFDRLVVR